MRQFVPKCINPLAKKQQQQKKKTNKKQRKRKRKAIKNNWLVDLVFEIS